MVFNRYAVAFGCMLRRTYGMVVLPNAQTIGCVYLQPPFGRLSGVDGSCLMRVLRARIVGAFSGVGIRYAFCAPASSVLAAA